MDPYFSPDGSQIAFSATIAGNIDVYVVPTKGGDAKRLTYHPGPDRARGWTPDGRRVRLCVGPDQCATAILPALDHRPGWRFARGAANAARFQRRLLSRWQPHRPRRVFNGVHSRVARGQLLAELPRRPHASDPHHDSGRSLHREASLDQQ